MGLPVSNKNEQSKKMRRTSGEERGGWCGSVFAKIREDNGALGKR